MITKDSFAKVPFGWTIAKVKDVADINPETITKEDDFKEIRYIDISSVKTRELVEDTVIGIDEAPSRAKRKVKDGDTIISTVRVYRKSYLYLENPSENTIVSTGFAVIRPKNADKKFLHYYLTSDKFINYLTIYSTGSAYPAVDSSLIGESDILLPSKREQSAIGEILFNLDEKISLNRLMNSTLEAIGQALFKHWFVDFEFPDGEGKPYRSSGGEMVDSAPGVGPRGGGVGTLGDVCAKITDGSHFSPKESDGNHLIATVRDMGAYDFDLNGCKKISDEDYQQLKKNGCRPEKGDILFSKDGTMGITHIYFGHQDIVLLSSIAIIRPKNNIYSNYVFLYLKSSSVQSMIFGGFVSGSALPRLVLKDIKRIPILIPSEKLIIQFNQIFNNPLIQIIENEKQSRILMVIRDGLLPRLMSGEIRVKEMDKSVEEVSIC
jgi:type I restriction enzyme S subunit